MISLSMLSTRDKIGLELKYSDQDSSNIPKVDKEKGSGSSKSTFPKCGKSHCNKCVTGTNGCFGCGKDGNKVRDCPYIKSKGIRGKQVHPRYCGVCSSSKE